jgi:hypothetical protein
MCIQGHSEARISQFYNKIRRTLSQAGFESITADKNVIFKLFNLFFQLPEENRRFTIDDTEIGFKSSTFQINHYDHVKKIVKKKYCRIVNLLQMPKGPIYDLWLSPLFDINDVIVSYS